MTTWGVTANGFILPTFDDFVSDIQAAFTSAFGVSINLEDDEFPGQLVKIFSDQYLIIAQQAQAVYNSYYPGTANGIQFDNVCSIVGIRRMTPTYSTVTGIATGTQGTIIPQEAIVAVTGNASVQFQTTSSFVIGAGTNEVQLISFSGVPDAGQYTLSYQGTQTGVLAYNANAAAVEAALNAVSAGFVVTGNYTSGFTVTYTGSLGSQPQALLTVATNTLTMTSTPVTVTISETTPGLLPNVACTMISLTSGAVVAYATTLSTIVTVVSGWTGFSNPLDATVGLNVEIDSAERLRRYASLANPGSTTQNAIRAKILQLSGVEACYVFVNDGDTVDGEGRPPHSFEAEVLGGSDADIVNTVFTNKAAGIQTTGNTSMMITDPQGFPYTVYYSRPTQVPIYIIVNIHVGANYPAGGDATITDNLVAFGAANYGMGDEVYPDQLFCSITDVLGVQTVEVLIGTAPSPTLSDPIPITIHQIAEFDTAFITVNHV